MAFTVRHSSSVGYQLAEESRNIQILVNDPVALIITPTLLRPYSLRETMKALAEKPIAVLGGGACGSTFAADLSLAGCNVRLYELPDFAPETLGEILETREVKIGGIQSNFKGIKRTGLASIDAVTTDISEALEGAGLIIVAIPAVGHEPFFERMIPELEDGQVISIFPDNFGSLVLKKMMREEDCDADVIIGGWSSMPYGTRKKGPGEVDCLIRTHEIIWDTLPRSEGKKFSEATKIPALDGSVKIRRGDTVISVDLSNSNPVVHVPGSILNVGAMEVSEMEEILNIPKGKYSMYKYGMSPSVSEVQFAFYQEERKIADALGIEIIEYNKEQFFWKGSVMGVEFWSQFADVTMTSITGPLSTEDRYFTEDIPVGCNVRYQLARKFDLDVPVIESLIRLGSVICGRDFFEEGRSLDEIGLEDLTKDQITKYVRGR